LHQRGLVGEDPGRFLGIDQPAVDRDLEDPAARFDQRDLRREGILEFRRQTGGMFAITSLIAEFDRDVHAAPPKYRVGPSRARTAPSATTTSSFERGVGTKPILPPEGRGPPRGEGNLREFRGISRLGLRV
jgi:hypothetical protein